MLDGHLWQHYLGFGLDTLFLAHHAHCKIIVMLVTKKTNTLDVDIFDIWHLSITGLLIKWYADNNGVSQGVSLFVATSAV